MKRQTIYRTLAASAVLAIASLVFAQNITFSQTGGMDESEAKDYASQILENAPTTVSEARSRARVLHETVHGSLRVMHRDFFREDEGPKIPSRSLEDVFSELKRSYGVELNWLAVDTKAMNIDHEPESDFEKEAVRALKSGNKEFESVADDSYRFAGRIRLSATCLSCHLSRRSSNDDRFAGLVITMPVRNDNAHEER